MNHKHWPFVTKISGLFLVLVAAMILLQMSELTESQLLWGHLPLWFYLSLHAGLLGLLYRFQYPTPPPPEDKAAIPEAIIYPNRSRALLWSTTTGLLLGFGFPGFFPFPFLLLFAFVPLLALQRELRLSGASDWTTFVHGLNAFVLYNALATFWVTNTAFGPGLFAIVANSLLMSIPWMLFHWTSRLMPKLAYLALPAYWISFEWGHYHWDLNWPWLTLGNGFAEFPSLIQWYEYTGALGGGLWIWISNLICLKLAAGHWADGLWASRDGSPYQPMGWRLPKQKYWGLLWIIGPLLFSLYQFHLGGLTNEVAKPKQFVSVIAVQPNFEPHFEKFTVRRRARMDTFLQISLGALAAHSEVDYLVFPETSFDFVNEDAVMSNRDLRRLANELSQTDLKYLVTGFDGYHIFGPGEPRTPAVRDVTISGRPAQLEALNAAVQVDVGSRAVQTYRKGVFVPGAESFPFRDVLWFAKPMVDVLGGSVAGRGTQLERTPFVGERAKIAPVICYESVFGDYFTDYVKAGAQAAFVMTNDGWWDNTAGHKQHLYFSSLRAIETRRPIVRSANVGACAFINAKGIIEQSTEYDQAGYLYGKVELGSEMTFYVRYGDWIPLILAICSIFFLLLTLVFRLRLMH